MATSRHSTASSRRWEVFYSAIHTAVQNVADKWNFDDFAECFPQYVEEDPDGARQTFNLIATYTKDTNLNDMEDILKQHHAQAGIDTLDALVKEAKARKASGNIGPDVSTPEMRAASMTGGRTFPILQAEAQRLRQSLQQIRTQNENLVKELEKTVEEGDKVQGRVVAILDKIDMTNEAWDSVAMEDLQRWTARISEETKPTLRS